MPPVVVVDAPSYVYQDQLASLSHGHGIALWPPTNPNPGPPSNAGPPRDSNFTQKVYEKVSIGDVGYLREGTRAFIRLFNVILPCDHPSNRTFGDPMPYKSLSFGPFLNVTGEIFQEEEYYSPSVFPKTNESNVRAREPDQ
jgi:hypothetical protein